MLRHFITLVILLPASVFLFALSGCISPVAKDALVTDVPAMASFDPDNELFIADDGARLGLTVWQAEGTSAPELVIVGLHGMNDWAHAFHLAAPYWAKNGVTTYAYDQRGFGRSPHKGLWPKQELLREDLRTAARLARERHPEAKIAVVGISMGGSVALSAFGSDTPPDADILIASGAGLRGWGAMNPLYRVSLWVSAHIRPSWVVTPPKRLPDAIVRVEPTDNIPMLHAMWQSPNMSRDNRIDQVYGVVSLMETAHKRAKTLPAELPVLLSYGAQDYVIPASGVKRTAKVLPQHARTIYYENGFHMLLRDLQSENVFEDYLTFMRDPDAALPSGGASWDSVAKLQ